MTHIDNLLVNIVKLNQHELDTLVSPRDTNVLNSLSNSIVSQYFITENQSKLLLRILQDNHHHFPMFVDELAIALKAPTWSKAFRQIEQVKKLYIGGNSADMLSLIIEFTFSTHVRKVLTQANKEISNLVQSANGKHYFADLTEQNIVVLVELLRPLEFEIDDQVARHYATIKSWNESVIKDQFLISSMTNQNFLTHITADLGTANDLDSNIIQDRSRRYQYRSGTILESDGTLTRELANRIKSRVWVDKRQHTLTQLVESLISLRRLPIMVVFDNYSDQESGNVLESLSVALEHSGIADSVGVYFRMPNTESGIKFNSLVADKKFNQYLGSDTKVVAVQSGKIPKFFLTNNWKPMSVIAIDHQFRSSKTAVYAGCCDLIVTYTETPPIVEKLEKWQ